EGAQERRLARIRQPDQADVGDQPQLEREPALLPGLALLGVPRGAMRGGREVDVTETAAPAARDHDLLVAGHEVRDQLAVREDRGARRDWQHDVAAGLAVPARAAALPAGVGPEVVLEAVIDEGRLAGIDAQVDGSAATSVATIRSAARDVGLTPEARCPVPAIP